jgi:SHS2 domain-containing protein
VRGHVGNARPLVKAVTRHDLAFEQAKGRWHARVVLDV